MTEERGTAGQAGTGVWQSEPHIRLMQRRTLRVLIVAQILGAFGMGASLSVGIVLAEAVVQNDTLAGIARTASTLGAAAASIPLARLAVRAGRRRALGLGWSIALGGAVALVGAAVSGSVVLLVVGMLLYGAGAAAQLQTRFAATDLATPLRRGSTLAVVVWCGTLGAVIGPNLGGPGEVLSRVVGLPPLAGAFVISAGFLLVAAVLTFGALRPDPLLLAAQASAAAGAGDVGASAPAGASGSAPAPAVPTGADARAAPPRTRDVLGTILATPVTRFALIGLVLSHATMVAVMTMTPVHMTHEGADITVVGLTISVHVLGMFAFAPLVGLASDRFGAVRVILGGQVVFVAGAAAALVVGEHSAVVWPTLLLLGIGWSCATVPASVLLSSGVPSGIRVPAQGVVDTTMNAVAALAALSSGPVFALLGFGGLQIATIVLAVAVIVAGAALRRSGAREATIGRSRGSGVDSTVAETRGVE